MAKLSEEIAAYERMQDLLETDHFGEWVVVHDGELIGTYSAFEDAADEAIGRFGRGPLPHPQSGTGPHPPVALLALRAALMPSVSRGFDEQPDTPARVGATLGAADGSRRGMARWPS